MNVHVTVLRLCNRVLFSKNFVECYYPVDIMEPVDIVQNNMIFTSYYSLTKFLLKSTLQK